MWFQSSRNFDYYKKDGCIALVCLNTWNIADTNVYEYDDRGRIEEEPSGFSTNINTHGANECSWMVASDPIRHTATVTLTYGDNSILDPERVSAQLCQECFKKLRMHFGLLDLKKTGLIIVMCS